MEVYDIIEEFESIKSKITNSSTIEKLLNRRNNLSRFDIANRLLFISLDEEVTDLRTKEEWYALGREIINTKHIIYGMAPVYTTKYTDSMSGDEIDSYEFTTKEIEKALEYDIIHKEKDVADITIMKLYDIRNTHKDNKSSIEFKPILPDNSIKSLAKILAELENAKITESDDITFLSRSEHELFIARDRYEETADKLCDELLETLFSREETLSLIVENSKIEKDTIQEFVKYSLKSVYSIEDKNRLDFQVRRLNSKDIDKMMEVVIKADAIAFNIINCLYKNDTDISDAASNIVRMKKVEMLLDIMQANYVQSKLKGN